MRAFALSAFLALTAVCVFADDEVVDAASSVDAAATEAESPSSTPEVVKPVLQPFNATSIKAPFLEQFTDDWSTRWTASEATKKSAVGTETFSYVGKWEVEESSVYPAILGDKGLVAKSKAAHHAISAPFKKAIDFKKEPLVVQYEVKYQEGGNCGGGYLKLLRDGFQSSGKEFDDHTPWVIMFGPDLTCPGTKVHFIFQHKNPITGEYEEKHLKSPPTPTIGKTTILYTLVVNPDNTFKILINGDSSASGSLLEDFTPAVNPEKEIDDADDKKPDDWIDEARIADPEATKPEDWDEDAPYEIPDEEAEKPEGWLDNESETIPDPEAEKPEEWDDDEDGDWIAPSIRNPKCDEVGCGEWKRPFKKNPDYKGKWNAPFIDNPAYKGPWAPKKIPNPKYFEDNEPVKSLDKIGGVGIELWTMTEDILFDNIYVGHSLDDAKALAAESFDIKRPIESDASAVSDKPSTDKEPLEDKKTFKEDPLTFLRTKIADFIESLKVDPVTAIKTQPETAGALLIGAVTVLGMLGTLFGVVGGAQKPVTKSTKKAEAPKPAEKPAAPVAAASGEKAQDGGLKKRTGK